MNAYQGQQVMCPWILWLTIRAKAMLELYSGESDALQVVLFNPSYSSPKTSTGSNIALYCAALLTFRLTVSALILSLLSHLMAHLKSIIG